MTVASNDTNSSPREARIELRLRELAQLFDSFDPAPFHEKDLDRDAEEFIVSWALEHPPDAPLVFRLHLPRDQQRFEPERVVVDAVHNYFAYRSGLARLDVRRTGARRCWSASCSWSPAWACGWHGAASDSANGAASSTKAC